MTDGPRIPLITDRDGLDEERLEVFDRVVESRGKMIRPFEVLLHVPGMAGPAAELGHQIRYAGSLRDHDRELAILTVARAVGCGFEWDSHVSLAAKAGVRDEVMDVLNGSDGELIAGESMIVDYVRALNETGTVSAELHAAANEALGVAGVVELATLVGYYTMLGYVMNTAGAC